MWLNEEVKVLAAALSNVTQYDVIIFKHTFLWEIYGLFHEQNHPDFIR